METLKVKTNINCSMCVAKVTPFLNGEESIQEWSVDTSNPDKILTVTGEQISQERVKELVKQAGFAVK